MRLIDADAYLKKACTYNETGCGSCKLQTICPVNEPTVDAVPVRHGRWVDEPNCMYRCSVCGSHYPSIKGYQDYKFCPNCGARMVKE